MGQMTTMGQIHAENSIAGLGESKKNRCVSLGSGVGLDISKTSPEQGANPVNGKGLQLVDHFTAAIISL